MAWYSKIDEYLLSLGFTKSLSELTFDARCLNAKILIISLYVDDILVIRSNAIFIEEFKQNMTKVIKMTNYGEMAFFLGIEVKQDERGVFISKKKYAKEILKKF